MANYVLVHGGNMTTETWNKLTRGDPVHTQDGTMGGRIWDPVIPVLLAQNHFVFAPTLEDEHSSSLTGHIEQVCTLIARHDLRDIILVAQLWRDDHNRCCSHHDRKDTSPGVYRCCSA
jgi:hypothetical protein